MKMMCAGNGIATHTAWNVITAISFLAAVMLVGTMELAAQRPSSTDPLASDVYFKHRELFASWRRGPIEFDQAAACGELQNALGDGAIRCSIPFNQIKASLHPRTLAWLSFVDERLSVKWYCGVPTAPPLLDAGIWTIDQISANEIQMEILTTAKVTRIVWMDGRRHPPPTELFYQGHTIGWFEGDELVIESTNFTFHPDGFEDHIHLPSSPLKKVTERYKVIAPDKLSLTWTHEDPLFVKKPFTWSTVLTKVTRPEAEENDCNSDASLFEMELVAPDRYEGR